MRNRFLSLLPIFFAAILMVGCTTNDDAMLADQPADLLYQKAAAALEAKKYERAAKIFDEVDRQHPYSKWATKAQLMSAYSQYMGQKYTLAIAGLDTFIQLHPGHGDAAYAYYLRALCYYEQIYDVRRDQKMSQYAYDSFQEVMQRFPKSKYAKDAKFKLDLTRDHIAGKEMAVGRYYMKRGGFLAAIKRFQRVVDEYQTTTHVQEALHRLVESYLALGMKNEAQEVASVMGHNYPDSPWYADSYYLLEGKDLRPDKHRTQASLLNRVLGKRLEG
jgi:outer membrane protein assembly factor BamD